MKKIEEKSIVIAGDLFPIPANISKFSAGDVDYLFGSRIISLFASADYRICNLEGALTDRPGVCEKTGPSLHAPTHSIRAYKALGIDCCTLANNHITDAGDVGVIDTMHTLDVAEIKHLGAGLNASSIVHFFFFQIGTRKVCLYNVGETMFNEPDQNKPGAYLYDEYIVCRELQSLKRECDILIVVYHGGSEKFRYPSPQTRKRFHRMVDNGANVILSQHTHCVGSEEWYKGAYLLYGQGNFLFQSFNNEFTDTGLVIELLLTESGFSVKKHLVNAVNDTVRYDEKQDFTSFDERSLNLREDTFVQREFERYCSKQAFTYLKAYKGTSLFLKIVYRLSPKWYKEYVLKSYRRDQLLFTLHSLRSEQNREVAIEGIKQLLKHHSY